MPRFLSPLHRPTLGALVVGLVLFATAQAQTFPSKPLKLVVPFGPGGSSDVVARIGWPMAQARRSASRC